MGRALVRVAIVLFLMTGAAYAAKADEHSDVAVLQTVQAAQERHLDYLDKRMDAVDEKLDSISGDMNEIKGIGVGLGAILTVLSGSSLLVQFKRRNGSGS